MHNKATYKHLGQISHRNSKWTKLFICVVSYNLRFSQRGINMLMQGDKLRLTKAFLAQPLIIVISKFRVRIVTVVPQLFKVP